MIISILVDDPTSWIMEWARLLLSDLAQMGHSATLIHTQNDIPRGDISFFLGCTRIVSAQNLLKNQHNLVVHPSDLPHGRGFSPLAWQVLAGSNLIPICLFEAMPEIDAGMVYMRDIIYLDGHELNNEIKEKQGKKVVEMCLRFVKEGAVLKPQPQMGTPTYYRRRTQKDSELDISLSLQQLFPLLRVVDNDRYPAFFIINGQKYILRIDRASDSEA